VAGKIIADIIEAPYDAIRMNVGNVTVLTANSSGLNYIPTGNVNINIGGPTANLTMNLLTANGIKFPATAVSSADANTLDDYEEGTFLPNVVGLTSAGTATYTSREGYYTKIGRMVFVFMNLRWSAHTGTGDLAINNMPFTVLSYAGLGTLTFNSGLSGTSGYWPAFWADAGGTNLRLWQSTFASGGSTIAIPMDTSVSEIHVSFIYTATS
jgi:hypothetical protein